MPTTTAVETAEAPMTIEAKITMDMFGNLVAMSDNIIQFDLLIQENENQNYVELKNIIARHPGPEIEEQILVYQQTLKEKNKQYMAMTQELDMYIEQVKRFQQDIADHDTQLAKLNKQWVKMTKKMRESSNGMNLSASMNGIIY